MLQRLLLAVCVLFTVTSIHGKEWQKHYMRAVRQLASGDEQEFQCMLAIITLGDECGENPFEDQTAFVNAFIMEDLKVQCSAIKPWFECVQRSFSSNCGSVNSQQFPFLEDLKRMISAAEVALNYVCVQHVDVLNRKKVCVVMQTPEVEASCSHLVQEERDNPLCMVDVPLQACATNVIATGCGQEIATVLSGLLDSIRAESGCPARRMMIKSLPSTLKERRGFPFYRTG